MASDYMRVKRVLKYVESLGYEPDTWEECFDIFLNKIDNKPDFPVPSGYNSWSEYAKHISDSEREALENSFKSGPEEFRYDVMY